MAAQKPKRSLPAGVGPVNEPWSEEDPVSHVRRKTPEAPGRNETTPDGTPENRARALVGDLVKLAPDAIVPFVRRLLPLGNFALDEIARQFPGPLWRPSLATDFRLPRPEEISATAAALIAFESEAVPYLSRLMRSPDTRSRYYATVVCAAYADPRLIEPLAQVVLDEDRECRRVALHLLSTYQPEPQYRAALGQMRRLASDTAQPLGIRRRAISVLTQLRDEASATLFIELLGDPDRGIGTASRVGLRVLTAHDFGFSREPWLRWLSVRGRELRIRWLIEGLGDSRANIRLLASRELWTLTRFLQPLSETASRKEFLEAQQHYQRWWSEHHPD